MLTFALAGCLKKTASTAAPLEVTESEQGPTMTGEPIAGPMRFQDADLCLEIPDRWQGRAVREQGLVELTHGSGVVFRLFRAERPVPGRTDMDLLFEDAGTYRSVPALKGGGTYTFVSNPGPGPTVQGWYAQRGRYWLVAEAEFPYAGVTTGLARVRPLLLGICD